jgi:hypothetical protein
VAENFQDKAANRTSLVMNRFVVEKYEIWPNQTRQKPAKGASCGQQFVFSWRAHQEQA